MWLKILIGFWEYYAFVEKVSLTCFEKEYFQTLNLLQDYLGDSISTNVTNHTDKDEHYDDELVSFRIFILQSSFRIFLCFPNRSQMKPKFLNRRRKIGMITTMR